MADNLFVADFVMIVYDENFRSDLMANVFLLTFDFSAVFEI